MREKREMMWPKRGERKSNFGNTIVEIRGERREEREKKKLNCDSTIAEIRGEIELWHLIVEIEGDVREKIRIVTISLPQLPFCFLFLSILATQL